MVDLPRLEKVLGTLSEHAGAAMDQFEYRMVGTAASVLHGVELPAGDVDFLLRERAGVDGFSRSLAAFKQLIAPHFEEDGGQYLAAVEIDGVEVEFSTVEFETQSDVIECVGKGPWTHYRHVDCGGVQVPVVALELRLLTELARQRPDRYRPIIQTLQARHFDRDLLLRGLKERGLLGAENLSVLQPLGLEE